MPSIETLTIEGYRSIGAMIGMKFGPLSIVVGANGAGKSNLVSFLRLLQELGHGRLQMLISKMGSADPLFHQGIANTKQIKCDLRSENFRYTLRLQSTDAESLVIRSERIGEPADKQSFVVSDFDSESRLSPAKQSRPLSPDETPSFSSELIDDVRKLLRGIRVHHFHDTDASAAMRRSCGIDQTERLHHDGSNLAAVLYDLRTNHPKRFDTILRSLKRIAPFVQDINFSHDKGGVEDRIRIIWTQVGSEYRFNAQHFSDGTIRFLCILVAIFQAKPPGMLVIDEPELGLHPEAVALLAGLLNSASHRMQLVVTTQSPMLLSQFTPDDVITVDQRNGCSDFRRLDGKRLTKWLKDYSLGEIWQKGLMDAEVQSIVEWTDE